MASKLLREEARSGSQDPGRARPAGAQRVGALLRPGAFRRPGTRRSRAWPYLVPIVVWLLLMFGYPILETIRMAFSYVNSTNFTTGGWHFAGFQNFRTLPTLQGFQPMLRNTGLFLVGSIVPQFVIGGLLAVALNTTSRTRRWARSLVLLPWLFPPVATATVFLWMFSSPSGLFDSLYKSVGLGHQVPYFLQTGNDALLVVIILNIWIGIPFNYLVIQSGLQSIPGDLHDAALIDGAGWLKELTRITIPLLRETLLTVLMLGILGTMNVFAFVWILTMGGPANATMLPGVLAYSQAFVNFNYGQGAAIIIGVVVVLLCVAGMYLVVTRSQTRNERRARIYRPAKTAREARA
ncbi:MAG TPA: sugar ABC transporter permease [Streptosporangiaceae bacterium]|jgi:multiple sugar transport system permease protein